MRLKIFLVLAVWALAMPRVGLAEIVTASHLPWSGYWWPMADGGLLTGKGYNGLPAPLDKYGYFAPDGGQQSKNGYASRYYPPDAESWWGMCWEWAVAASVEPEPREPGVLDHVPILVGDKKGLLTLAHSRDVVVFGDGSDPVVFHSWLLEKVKGQGKVFVADLAPGPEVWSYPVYKYDMTTQALGQTILVTCRIYYVDDFVRPDFVGQAVHSQLYTYSLNSDGAGNIVSGSWTGASVSNHPEKLTLHVAKNLEAVPLDQDVLDRLVNAVGDPWEQDGGVGPGTYPLVVHKPRTIALYGPASAHITQLRLSKTSVFDTLQVGVEQTTGSLLPLDFGARREVLFQDPASTASRLHFTSGGTEQAGICNLVFDVTSADAQTIPFVHPGDTWIGVGQTLQDASGPGGMLVGRSLDGQPITTFSPDHQGQGKRLFLLEAAYAGYGFLDRPSGIDFFPGPGAAQTVILGGGPDMMLASYGPGQAGQELVSPGVVLPGLGYSQYLAAIRNRSSQPNEVRVRSYSSSGQLNDEAVLTLGPQETRRLSFGNSPFFHTRAQDWLLLNAQAEIEMLGLARSSRQPSLGENFYATQGQRVLYMPHAPTSDGWNTFLTLINPNPEPVAVTLTQPASGRVVARFSLGAKERLEQGMATFLGQHGLEGQVLRVEAASPLVGYVSFISGTDAGTLPLLGPDNVRAQLTLPHAPSFAPWWTGVALGNVSGRSQTLRVEAFDEAGQSLPVAQGTLTLGAGRSLVALVQDLVGPAHTRVGSLTLTCADPDAVVGFYLFGNSAQTMLTGNNF